jgi:hypothetical protein
MPRPQASAEASNFFFCANLYDSHVQHEVDKFKGAHEEISLRLFRQGKEPKGKKILVHPLRVLGTRVSSSPLRFRLSHLLLTTCL